MALKPIRLDQAHRSQDGAGDREVEAGALLLDVGRRQVYGDPSGRKVEPTVFDGCPYPVAALLDRGIRQPDSVEVWQAGSDVDLYVDHVGLDACNCAG
jgi:hypothetical protein